MKRRDFITLLGGAVTTLPLVARAQQQAKLPIIGFLGPTSLSAWRVYVPAFTQRLGELGWIDGQTVAIEYRWADGRAERYSEIADEFARSKVNVIVTGGSSGAAAKRVTSTIPIVLAVSNDPVGDGSGRKFGTSGRERHRLIGSRSRTCWQATRKFSRGFARVPAAHDPGQCRISRCRPRNEPASVSGSQTRPSGRHPCGQDSRGYRGRHGDA